MRLWHFIAAVCLLAWVEMSGAQSIILDNGDASGFTVLSGSWFTSTAAPGYCGSNYLACKTTAAGGAPGEVEWRPTLPSTGDYRVSVRYVAGTNRATDAPFTVYHASGATTITVNQQVTGSQWISLGVFPFEAGASGCIRLSNAAGLSYVIADAVALLDLSQVQPIAPDDSRLQLEGSFFSGPDVSGFLLRRFSSDILAVSTSTYSADLAKTASGIGIRLRTDSPWLRARFEQTPGYWVSGQFVAFQDGTLATIGETLDVETASLRPGQPVTYRIVCPPYESLAFTGLEIQAGATVYPLPAECRPRYAAFGDSITHGSGMPRSDQTYAWLLAEAKGWEVFNFGVGSSKTTPSFGSMLDNEILDVATVLWGQNDLGAGVADFTSRYQELLTNLRRSHPKTALYCITLTAIASTETQGRNNFRQAVRDIVAARIAAGDTHIHVLEGLELSTPADLRDTVHFSATGNANVAARLAASIHYPGGSGVFLDFDRDCDIDDGDFETFLGCVSGPAVAIGPGCEDKDFDADGDVDQSDFGVLQRCFTGGSGPINRDCVD